MNCASSSRGANENLPVNVIKLCAGDTLTDLVLHEADSIRVESLRVTVFVSGAVVKPGAFCSRIVSSVRR